MNENGIKQVSDFILNFEGLELRGYVVLHGPSNKIKRLFSILDVEKALGFSRQGWHWTRTAPKIRIKKQGYTDAETILRGIKKLASIRKSRNSHENLETLQKLMSNFVSYEKSMSCGSFSDIKKIWPKFVTTTPLTSDDHSVITEIESYIGATSIDNKPETNNAASNVPSNFSWSFVFDNAKEITRYQEVSNEEIALTQSIAESKKKLEMIQMQMYELQSEIEQKEEQSKQNRLLLQDFRQSLQDNPLLKNLFEGQKEINSANADELSEKIDRLERENQSLRGENQSLKDKLGEGENFRTANMFPDKEKYFDCKNFDPNNKLGVALSRMASRKGIEISKVRSGAMQVGNYPIWLHEKLKEWIEGKRLNEYTADLQPMLKPEYRAV